MEKDLRHSSLANIGLKKFAPAIVCFIVVFILICLPESNLPESNEWDWLNISFLDKWIHAIMFAIMTFLFLLPVAQSSLYSQQKRHYFIRIGLSACIWGLVTEYIQKFYIPTRAFDFADWLSDCAGVLVAFLYCRKFHMR
jgi:VanZ family protein